jgi:hypothetical protein
MLICAAMTTAAAADATRTSTSVQKTGAERAAGQAGKIAKDEYAELNISGSRSADKHSSRSLKPGAGSEAVVANYDFWFYAADVLLFNDHDADGHFHGVDLLFDADTYYEVAEVYAVVYLSLEDGPWNEYSATDNFLLYGASADDEFNIVTELVSGYPTGSYDLLIELFDGFNDEFLASFGPIDTSELAFLPLEDANRDEPYVPPPPGTTVVVQDGGGAISWLALIGLALATLLLRKLRQERAQQAILRIEAASHLAKEVQSSRVRLNNRLRT